MIKFSENYLKSILRYFYKIICSSYVIFIIFIINRNQKNIKPFFCGAYAGNFGGTLVKILRLKSFFFRF